MPRRSTQTFKETLLAVALRNVQTLETKADTACSLAETYPENEGAFRAVQSEAVKQMFRILVHMPSVRDAWATVGEGHDRELAVATVAAD